MPLSGTETSQRFRLLDDSTYDNNELNVTAFDNRFQTDLYPDDQLSIASQAVNTNNTRRADRGGELLSATSMQSLHKVVYKYADTIEAGASFGAADGREGYID